MRLRFTIRDLLWLAALVALAVGWWLDRNNLAREVDSLKTQPLGPFTIRLKETYSDPIPTDYSLIGPPLQSPTPTK